MYFRGWSSSKGMNRCASVSAYAGASAVRFPDNKSANASISINFYSGKENDGRKLQLVLSKDEAREMISKLACAVQSIEDKEAEESEEVKEAAFKWYHRMTDR